MRVAPFALFSAVLLVLTEACVSDPPAAGDAGKITGEEGGPCFSDFTCKTGLVCNLGPNACVKPGTDGAVVDTGTGGDGPTEAMMNDGGLDAAPCLTGTVAWWECETNANDRFQAHNGTAIGTVTFVGNGKVNRACDFAGGYFTATWGNNVLGQTSVDFWIQSSGNVSGTQTVVSVRDSNNMPVWTITLLFKTLTFTVAAGQAVVTLASPSYHHVAFVYDVGKLSSYYDGTVQTNAASSGSTTLIPSKAIAVGADIDGMGAFTGQLDEIAVYRTALSANDVSILAQGGNTSVCRMP